MSRHNTQIRKEISTRIDRSQLIGKDGEVTSLREYAVHQFEQKGATVWVDLAKTTLEKG